MRGYYSISLANRTFGALDGAISNCLSGSFICGGSSSGATGSRFRSPRTATALRIALVAVLALVLAAAGPARAEMIAFSYTFSVNPHSVGDPSNIAVRFTAASLSGNATVPLGTLTDKELSSIGVYSTGPGAGPVTFDAPLHFGFTVTDPASGQSASLSFPATLAGTISSSSQNLNIFPLASAPEALRIGDHVYHVWLGEMGFPTTDTPFGASVAPFVHVTAAPEPSSLLLGSLGVLGLTGCGWLRRRAARRA